MEDTFPSGTRRAIMRRRRWIPTLALATAAALGQAGCSHYMGTTATSFLRKVREEGDPNQRYVAYAKLGNMKCYETPEQRAEAAKTLVEVLEKRREPLASRAVILSTLGKLGDPVARDVVVAAVSDPEPLIRVEACRALGFVGKPEDATVLARVMVTDTLMDARIAAIDGLGDLKVNDPRIHRVLVSSLEHDDPATRYASLKALRKMTGKDYGVEAVAWQKNLIGDAPAGDASSPTLLAAPSPAIRSAGPGPDTGVYPPRPAQHGITMAPDSDAQTVNYMPNAAPQPYNAPGNPKYPPTNPNLPPPR